MTVTEKRLSFPQGFVWGAATSAYQIEGAWNVDGRGESIWDRFCRTPGKVHNGESGDVACDHYHRFAEDVALMRELGLKAYRFSVSWPRVIPAGRGQVNWLGIDFYDRLVDTLLVAGIEPFVTLFHWDLPQALQDKGGWENRDTCLYLADYASLMIRRLGDRVKYWTTLNEPWVFAFMGYRSGEHAPGVRDEKRALQVAHNLMVGHGLAIEAMRAAQPRAQLGITLFLKPAEPASDAPEDEAAAEFTWQKDLGWFLSPLLNGCYPPDVLRKYESLAPVVLPGDMALICQHMDLLGINYYMRSLVGAKGTVDRVPGAEYTAMDWEVHAPALRRLLVRINKDYDAPPLWVTENGCAYEDALTADGKVHDPRRIKFFEEHLEAVHGAIADGVDLRGYFAWSLMDNFEWVHGYSKRFGLIYVDYPTQKRVIKDSGHWYSRLIQASALGIEEPAATKR